MRFHEPLLSPAEEIALARTIEAGVAAAAVLARHPDAPHLGATEPELRLLVDAGEAARERFLLANCRLVQLVAHPEATRLGLPADELFQEGFLGLVEALERFDHTRGTRFATVALVHVRSRVTAAARTRCGALHAPAWAVRRHGTDVGRTVPLAHDDVEIPLPCPRAAAAFDDALGHDDLGLARLLAALPPDERLVLGRRFGSARATLRDVADELGLSPSTVRRTEERALARLRGQMSGEALAA